MTNHAGRTAERAEAALRESEQRLRLAQEAGGLGVFDVNLASGVHHWDAATREIWGLAPDEPVSHETFLAGLHPDDREQLRAAMAGPPDPHAAPTFTNEYRVINQRDGAERWVSASGTTVFEEGRAVRIVGFVVEISARKRVEAALRESLRKHRELFDNAQTGMFRTRLDGSGMLDVNPRFLEIVGRTREEVLGVPSLSFWADADERAEMVRRLEAEGRVNDFECGLLNKQGEVRTCLTSLSLDPERGILEGSITDITERKRADEALRESEARYRGYVDNAPHGVFVSDEDGRYLEANKAAAELTGYAQEELVQLHIANVLAPQSHEWAQRHFARAVRTGHSSGNGVFLRKDGTTFPARVDAVRLAATRYLGFIIDISEEQRAAAELEASAAQVKDALTATVAALSATTELRDPYTAGHQRRVAELAGAIAVGLGWDEARIEMVKTAGLLHDVGKIIVPAEILSKPGRLSELEMEIIRGHAAASAALIAGIEFGGPVAAIVNQHHERLDGSGYPQGLTGENILPEARILAVADVVEAMASHRPYRPALPLEDALAEIETGAGCRYDVDVCAAVLRLFRAEGFAFTE